MFLLDDDSKVSRPFLLEEGGLVWDAVWNLQSPASCTLIAFNKKGITKLCKLIMCCVYGTGVYSANYTQLDAGLFQ